MSARPPRLPRTPRPWRQAGFTLTEILIALLISSIGLLGLVGMQALALVSTQTSSVRSLVALQASSLAAAMHSNTRYWVIGTSTSGFSINGTTINDNSNQLGLTGSSCDFTTYPSSGQCTPVQLAAFDLQSWAANMNRLLPSYAANLACTTNPRNPLSCQLDITWTERYVAMGRNTQNNSTATGGARRFTLYIQP